MPARTPTRLATAFLRAHPRVQRATLVLASASNTAPYMEWTAFGQIGPTLNLLGGVSYMQSQQRDTSKDSYGVPDWTVNLGLDWATPVRGLSLGGRVVHTGKQWVDSANTLQLPSAQRLDLSAKYQTQLGQAPVVLHAFVENVTNRRYWSGVFSDGYAMPSPPRTLRLAATFSF